MLKWVNAKQLHVDNNTQIQFHTSLKDHLLLALFPQLQYIEKFVCDLAEDKGSAPSWTMFWDTFHLTVP